MPARWGSRKDSARFTARPCRCGRYDGVLLNKIRTFLAGRGGRATAIAGTAAAIALMLYVIQGSFGPGEAAAWSRERVYICAETGKPFEHTIKLGDRIPVDSPHSDKKTGYPAELCYWTGDGKPKQEPTPVLLNQYAGKPGATFCPDCKRLVVGQNPPAVAGMRPPPTQDEYQRSRKEPR